MLLYFINQKVSFSQRFITLGDNQRIFGYSLNTSGRAQVWELMLQSWKESKVFGLGFGSTSKLLTTYFPTIAYPHNDYLKILTEFGVIGILVFLSIIFSLVATFYRCSRISTYSISARSALASTFTLLLVMITDNALAYQFVLFPTAILYGLVVRDYRNSKIDTVMTPKR